MNIAKVFTPWVCAIGLAFLLGATSNVSLDTAVKAAIIRAMPDGADVDKYHCIYTPRANNMGYSAICSDGNRVMQCHFADTNAENGKGCDGMSWRGSCILLPAGIMPNPEAQ